MDALFLFRRRLASRNSDCNVGVWQKIRHLLDYNVKRLFVVPDFTEDLTMQPHERIFVAVDTNDVWKARDLADQLQGKVGGFKIGLELITSIWAQLMSMSDKAALELLNETRLLFRAIGKDLFWDGKFDDIPNTVAGAALGLAPLSPKFFNVHASSGFESVMHAVANRGNSKVLAVTLLTSFDLGACEAFFEAPPSEVVSKWARIAVEAGADGLICSPTDLEWINRDEQLAKIDKMTPGIRPVWSEKGDQSRIMTPAKALAAGVTWMVIGRPIALYPEGPVKAVERIVDEIAAAA